MTKAEEAALIRRVCDGDPDAFEPLVLEHQTAVYHLALRMVGNPQDATDLTQEIFLQAYRSLSSFRGESRFFVWLYRLAHNRCTDFLRQRKPTLSLTLDDDAEEIAELDIPDRRFSPETVLEQKELHDAIERGLQQLSPAEREILTLREYNDCSYDEIANILSLEPGTVRSRIFRARKKLCAILIKDGNFSEKAPSEKNKGV